MTVSEDEIRKAMRRLAADPKTLAEPSGAVAVAAFLFHRDQLPRTTMNVAVISGGNVEAEMLAELRRETMRLSPERAKLRYAKRGVEGPLPADPG